MKIIIAPDSFKGTLTSVEICNYIEKGIKKAISDAEIIKLPMSDGGEGLVDVLVYATGGKLKKIKVKDPLERSIEAHYGILGNGNTAVIEMATASGLPLLKKEEYNPLKTTTYGTGQLIKAALDHNVKKIIVGIGGSATVDGGTGMAAALGVDFLNKNGQAIELGGGPLSELERIDTSKIDRRLKDISIEIACDVNNPLTGKTGAARIYAPQKGATPEMVDILENNLKKLASVIKHDTGIDVENKPGSGAAGGLGAGLMAFTGGKLKSGIDLALDNTGFDKHLNDADLVITGEGQIDDQTLYGKVPVGVSNRAKLYNCPVIAIAGRIDGRIEELYSNNILSYFSIIHDILPEEEVYARSGTWLELSAEQIIRTVLLGKNMIK